jgi:hypothetical protein
MLLKSIDDKSKRLRLLEELQSSDRLDARQREWLKGELKRFQSGMSGERDAAHYIDMYLADGKNHVILHDLRLEADGQTAQIDHLIIGRAFVVYLLETKTFGGSLHINEHGEFHVEYPNERSYGIESPLEQSRRHETVVRKVFDRLGIVGRAGTAPWFEHVVLVHPKAIIHRPPKGTFDSSRVIKADQFGSWHTRLTDTMAASTVMGRMLNFRSLETIVEWGQMLRRAHRPQDLLALPEFMTPRATGPRDDRAPARANTAITASAPAISEAVPKDEFCAECGKVLTPSVVQFCRDNTERFSGHLYCFQHQKAFRRRSNRASST